MIIILLLLQPRYIRHCFVFTNFIVYIGTHQLFMWICELQVILSGDVELNPGPKPNSSQNFPLCHGNLSNIPAHKFSKISLLSARKSLYKSDRICLSETYLDSSILLDTNLEMQGYTLIRAEYPSNVKRVCFYYKNYLLLKLLNINYL